MGKLIFKHSRKAEVEAQLNWVFVAILGTIILLFFTTLVFKLKANSEKKINAKLSGDLSLILSSSKVSSNTFNELTLPDVLLTADETGLYAGGVPITTGIFFASSELSGSKLFVFSKEFSYPFFVDNILYLFTNEDSFFVVGDLNDLAAELDDLLVDELPIQFITSAEYQSDLRLNTRNHFLILDPSVNRNYQPADCDDRGVSCTFIRAELFGTANVGRLNFYKDGQSQGSATFFDVSLLLSSLFVDSFELYERNARLLYERSQLLAQIYQERAQQLHDIYSSSMSIYDQDCAEYMEGAMLMFDALSNQDVRFSDLNEAATRSLYQQVYGNEGLGSVNRDLKLGSCALLY